VVKHLGLIAGLSLLAVLAPIPAQAGDYVGDDRIGDVEGFTYDPLPRPCGTITDVRPTDPRLGDIKQLGISHGADQIDLTLRLRSMPNLQRSSLDFALRTPDQAFAVDVYRSQRRNQVMVSVEKPPPPPPHGVRCYSFVINIAVRPCPAAEADLDTATSTVSLSVPRSCLSSPKWIRVGAEVSTYVRGVSYHDAWAPRGSRPSGPWGHVYGPRVRAAR
jgi:hypothetical protein